MVVAAHLAFAAVYLIMLFTACAFILWGASAIYSHSRAKQYEAYPPERDRSHLRLVESDDRKP